MRKLIGFIFALMLTPAFAIHTFTVCYYNLTNTNVSYNNEGLSHNWKSRGELTGSGVILASQNKCFYQIADETLFSSHYITFNVNNKWVGIVNPGFAHPYVIAQDAAAQKTGSLCLEDSTSNGKDNYVLNIFLTNNGIIYSNSSNPKDQSSIIKPRAFK